MLRTLQTAFEICKILRLDMMIVPSLSTGSHIVHQFGITFDDKQNLIVKQKYLKNVRSVFLTKNEILDRFQCKDVRVHFVDIIHNSLRDCFNCLCQIHSKSQSDTILCVTHRKKYAHFKVNANEFNLKRNIFGKIKWKRQKMKPKHCEMWK